jgi:hypothetical protein
MVNQTLQKENHIGLLKTLGELDGVIKDMLK